MKLKSPPILAALSVSLSVALSALFAMPVCAQVIFYESENFQGRTFSADREVGDFVNFGFNDRASSVVVLNERWLVCQDADFRGDCKVLRPGRYRSLAAMGLNNMISSARMASSGQQDDEARYAPLPVPVYDSRRRGDERLYRVPVTSVRAVVGAPEERCWIEHQGAPDRGRSNVSGAVVGAILGGVLGHQIGNGSGRDVATAGGVVAGAVLGSNAGRNRDVQPGYTHDVRRCEQVQDNAAPEYWDVTYSFRDVEHHVQLANPPGPDITVNGRGEPRS
jgi:uncharacterized protein YcfJ